MKHVLAFLLGFVAITSLALSSSAENPSGPSQLTQTASAPQPGVTGFLNYDKIDESRGDYQWHFLAFDSVPNPQEAFLLDSAKYAGGVLDCKDGHKKPHLYIYEANVFMRERGDFYFASKEQYLEVFLAIKAHPLKPTTFVIDTVDRLVGSVTIHLDDSYTPPRRAGAH